MSNHETVNEASHFSELKDLPEYPKMGKIVSLKQAISENKALLALVERFVHIVPLNAKYKLLDEILYKWAGVEKQENLRGRTCKVLDIRKIVFMELATSTVYPENLDTLIRTNEIEEAYENLKDEIYAQLMGQTYFKDLISGQYDDLSRIVSLLIEKMDEQKGTDKMAVLIEIQNILEIFGLEEQINIKEIYKRLGQLDQGINGYYGQVMYEDYDRL